MGMYTELIFGARLKNNTPKFVIDTLKYMLGEIEIFLDWIKPYIDSGSGEKEMYAIVTYEEGEPVIYSIYD